MLYFSYALCALLSFFTYHCLRSLPLFATQLRIVPKSPSHQSLSPTTPAFISYQNSKRGCPVREVQRVVLILPWHQGGVRGEEFTEAHAAGSPRAIMGLSQTRSLRNRIASPQIYHRRASILSPANRSSATPHRPICWDIAKIEKLGIPHLAHASLAPCQANQIHQGQATPR